MKSVRNLINKGILVTPKAYDYLKHSEFKEEILNKIESIDIQPELITIDYINSFIRSRKTKEFKILKNYSDEKQRAELDNFINHFNHRYSFIKSLLLKRLQTKNTVSIRRAINSKKREEFTLIAMVTNLRKTRNDHIMLSLEDPTGTINAIALKNKNVIENARDLVFDEVVAVKGTTSNNNMFFINEIYFPEVPIRKDEELPHTQDEVYALFTSDLHIGSKNFLEKNFKNFLKWLKTGNSITKKTKYLFITGDIIDGVGVFPGQEKELEIHDVYKQYDYFTQLIKEVPDHIKIIICPGNHEGLRLSEPQPPIPKSFSKELYELSNVYLVSNPSLIQLPAYSKPFKVLLYHGVSFDYYIATVSSLREQGGYDRADKIMEFLLRKRHLAPSHDTEKGAPTIAPTNKDHLLIDEIPDVFASGHIHKTTASTYRGIITLCCSSWQSRTPFQEKRGHVPEPARAIALNMKNRKFKIMKFD